MSDYKSRSLSDKITRSLADFPDDQNNKKNTRKIIKNSTLKEIKQYMKLGRRYSFFQKLFVILGLTLPVLYFLYCLFMQQQMSDVEISLYIIILFFYKIIMRIERGYMNSGTIRKGQGSSMFPTISNGDFIRIKKYDYKKDKLQKGDIIGFKLPILKRIKYIIFRDRTIVKRIDRLNRNQNYVRVLGDNFSDSWDSRGFGNIKFDNIEYKVEEIISLRDIDFLDRKNKLI